MQRLAVLRLRKKNVARIIPRYGFILKLHKEFYKGGREDVLKEYFL
jgi:hypothetical protein